MGNLLYYFNIALLYGAIGFGIAFLYSFLFKKKFLGNFVGAVVVGLVGACLGGIFEYLFSGVIEFLTHINGSINLFPPLITSFIVVWLFAKASEQK